MPVAPSEMCTAPGLENRLTYTLEIQEVLKQTDQKFKPKQVINFGFTSMSHWSVPEDDYASQLNQDRIFYLNVSEDGTIRPMHTGFPTDTLENKKKIKTLVKTKKK